MESISVKDYIGNITLWDEDNGCYLIEGIGKDMRLEDDTPDDVIESYAIRIVKDAEQEGFVVGLEDTKRYLNRLVNSPVVL